MKDRVIVSAYLAECVTGHYWGGERFSLYRTLKEQEHSIERPLRRGHVTSKKRFAYRLYRQNGRLYACLIKDYYGWKRIDRKWYGATGFSDRCGI